MTRHERTLLDVLDSHPCPNGLMIFVAIKELCTVLEDMHNAGFAHNDIKPQNISVKERELHTTVTLLDAGHVCRLGEAAYRLSRKYETSAEREYNRRRKYKWLAPEVYSECQPVTRQGDVYSLGYMIQVLLYKKNNDTQKECLLANLSKQCLGPEQSRPSISSLYNAL
ncbi:hypothetical protein Pcinc_020597 [Petrolisthes cinctipes]|uniref:non-specific serine/threonine protein kinase n=1 Tax=Petrolisthes cinctipes TaxID=88211 RepID=A0AAE1ESX7_PETCI|nr:hypothetical protein Pcinc_033173 [Petrolisthes cinctipes]KAK3874468.1 hypothetical protein Pcinc_020597 [Petrolisthes cinctipes]